VKRRLALALALIGALAAGWWLGRSGPRVLAGARAERAESPVGGLTEPAELELPGLADGPVHNVVLIVGDGLGIAQLAAARIRALGPDARFVLERLPVTGLVATHASGDLVTRSDAGATAFASGVKSRNGAIGLDAEGRPVRTLVEELRDRGWLTGLVTSSYVFDATPAAFVAHHPRRRDYGPIIDQMADSGVDLLVGGGLEAFRPESAGGSRPDGRDRIREAEERGVGVATSDEELRAADALPLWAILPGRDLGDGSGPELGELAEKSLELLSAESARRGAGFFLLLEEEAIDSASHALDLERLTRAVLRLDRAVAAAAAFAARDGATLVVVTADHSTGGLVIDEASTADRLQVVWGGDEHGGEPVPLFAYGPSGAAALFTGLMDNTEVHDRILEAIARSPAPEPTP